VPMVSKVKNPGKITQKIPKIKGEISSKNEIRIKNADKTSVKMEGLSFVFY